jgi:2-polyprenyl-3-methyl-5-hydroxy-6-metoxy-1,4-benzoquinol methylase
VIQEYPATPELMPENVYGHTKKIRLLRESLSRLRTELGRGLQILDVGCGNGRAVTRYLAHPADHVIGLDFHEPSVEYARAHFGSARVEFRVQDVEQLRAEGLRADAVVLADVLEHVYEPARLLQSAASILPTGGRVLITVPNGRGGFEIESAISKAPVIGRSLLHLANYGTAFLDKFVVRGAYTRAVGDLSIPYNAENGHVQFFRRADVLSMAEAASLALRREQNLSLFSGPFTNFWMAPVSPFVQWNSRFVDRLPPALASAWYFEFTRQ